MIATRANKEGKSKALRTACEELLQVLGKEQREKKNPKHFYGLAGFLLLLVAIVGYKFNQIVEPFYSVDSTLPMLMMFMAGVGIVASIGIARMYEIDLMEHNEVSADFYEQFVKSAKQFPDLIIAVEGQTHLTLHDAKKSLIRLRCRAMIEIQNEKPVGATAAKALHDIKRAAFQQLSMKDTSQTPATSTTETSQA